MCFPYQADLKNRAAWHEAHSLGRAPLNITLPDALLDRWPSLDLSADQSAFSSNSPSAPTLTASATFFDAPTRPQQQQQQAQAAARGQQGRRADSPLAPRRRVRLIDRLWLVLCLSTLALIAFDRRRHRTLRRLIMQFASMYLLRCFTLPWTILPKTDPHCQNEVRSLTHSLTHTYIHTT